MRKMLIKLSVICLILTLTGCGYDLPLEETGPAPETSLTEPEVTVEKPPLLCVTGPDFQAGLDSGNFSWNYSLPDGNFRAVLADGLHPTDPICWESLKAHYSAEKDVSLAFDYAPDSIDVWCYGHGDGYGLHLPMDGNSFSFIEGEHIYHIHARWEEGDRSYWGEADYLLIAEYCPGHMAAANPQTVEDPITGYCGNIVTTVYKDGKEFSFMYEDSVAIADILLNLAYDSEKKCRCIHEFEIAIDRSEPYQISLSNAFVRCGEGQASLTEEQVQTIRQIIEKLR